jgi:DNA-binding protein HU-beta
VTKNELIDEVALRSGMTRRKAAKAVDAILETIEASLRDGREVTFPGFGKFSVSSRSARQGRNPATGEKLQIGAARQPKFTAGVTLKRSLKSPSDDEGGLYGDADAAYGPGDEPFGRS